MSWANARLAAWIGRPDRPRALTGLVPLGVVRLAGFIDVRAVYAPRSGRVSVFLGRRLLGQASLGAGGGLVLKRGLRTFAAQVDRRAGEAELVGALESRLAAAAHGLLARACARRELRPLARCGAAGRRETSRRAS